MFQANPAKEGWSEDEVALMEEHLGGNVLPFFEADFYGNWTYDEDYDELFIYIVSAESVANAAAALEAAGYAVSYDADDAYLEAYLEVEGGTISVYGIYFAQSEYGYFSASFAAAEVE